MRQASGNLDRMSAAGVARRTDVPRGWTVAASRLLVLWSLVPFPAHAQAPDTTYLDTGQRIRVLVPGSSPREGTLEGVLGNEVGYVDRETGALTWVELTRRSRLQVFEGRHRPVWRSAGYGAVAGAALGAFLGLAAGDACTLDAYGGDRCSDWTSALGGAGLVAIPGGLIGMLFGIPERDRWGTVDGVAVLDQSRDRRSDAGWSVRTDPRGRMGVALSLPVGR